MWKRTILLVSIGISVCLVGTASAVTSIWTNAAGTRTWCNAGNWSSGFPGAGDTAKIDETSPQWGPIIDCGTEVGGDFEVAAIITVEDQVAPGQGIIMDVNYSGTVNINAWNVRHLGGTVTVNINGIPDVSISPGDKWRFGDSATSTLNIDGNPNIVANGIRGADSDDGTFTLNMTGGTLHLLDELSIGDNGGGEINLSGGSLIVDTDIALGDKRGVAPITVNMISGLIRTGQLQLPSNKNRAGVVRVNLHGGVLDCGEFVHGSFVDAVWSETDDWRLDIEQGTLKIAGDVRDEIDANVAAGQITAYDRDGKVVVALVGPNTVVTALPPDPLTATKPFPAIGSDNVDPNVIMHWTPGTTADTHDVYFGTSFDDVNDGTGGTFISNQGPNTFDPCGAGAPLEYLTTYYWRIDEVEIGGVTTHRGRVWSFTTGTVLVDPNMIMWYKFDESTGSTASDSSGYGRHASIYVRKNQPPYWDSNGYDANCLAFHKTTSGEDEDRGVTSVQPPSGSLSSISGGITLAVWLSESWNHVSDQGETPHNWVFDAGTGGETGQYHVQAAVPLDDERHVRWRAGNDSCDTLEWDFGGGSAKELVGWHHWAFVKDESQDKMSIYLDGIAVKSKSDVLDTLANVSNAPFKIGATTWVNYDYAGFMDNFRVYDRALSDDEVARLVRENPDLAWGPSPFDGQTDVPRDVKMIWNPGDSAAEHDVYLGTDFDDVNDASTNSISVYKGRQGPNEFDPGTMQLDTTYYWRIDEVNDPCVWKGGVWRFTVGSFLIVDDFESYDDSANLIYYTWEDGFINDTGSFLDLASEPFDPIHGGRQSMLYVYDNTTDFWGVGYYSEAKLPFDPAQDWTEAGVKALTLYFYGDPDNDVSDTEQLYVGLEGSFADVNYTDDTGNDMNDLKKTEWTAWNVAISDFTGVDPCAVTSLLIGFGDRDNTDTAGGDGTVYFDDIRLYPARCVPSILKPVGDLSNNCIVDWADVGAMAGDWLHADSVPVEAPSPGPVAYWDLDGDADDSSGNVNHGTAQGTYAWVAGHIGTDAIEFSGDGGKILVPDSPELRPADQLTVTAWVNTSVTSDYQSRVVSKGLNADNRDNFGLFVNENDTAGFYARDSNETIYFCGSDEQITPGEWHHIAGSYDGSALNCYVDGRLDNSEDEIGEATLLQDTNELAIGDMVDADRVYIGKVDDVQFFDYALSVDQVAYLGTEGTGNMSLTSEANLYDLEPAGQKAINIKDAAVLLEHWLEQKLWPQ